MCGIAGLLAYGTLDGLTECVGSMLTSLAHRGPDDCGVWGDAEHGVVLGHRRLAILDLSPAGHQPMPSASGRYHLVYNGEIYNFEALRKTLEAEGDVAAWRGHSDTEVLLAAFEVWGVEATLRRLVGMFAIAVWDKADRTLTLARDRMGEKPLYYGFVGERFVFASEQKAIHAVFGDQLQIDRDALGEFMRFGYIPAPKSIYRGISKLLPGHFLRLKARNSPEAQPQVFWEIGDASQAELRTQLSHCDDAQLTERVDQALREAVRLQMVSDVPLGAFLSGGIDSSAVVSLMQAQSSQRVRTFTIGFAEDGFNEAPYAQAVAKHLGTDHTEMYVSADIAASVIPELPRVYDEPFADSSQIPTMLVSRLTRQHVTVSLSGDGGDELFAGYPRYQMTESLWRRVSRQPKALRRSVAAGLACLPARDWDRILSVMPARLRNRVNGHQVHRAAQLMTSSTLAEMYVRLRSQWQPEDSVVLGSTRPEVFAPRWRDDEDPILAMRQWDLNQYLPDDLLVKADRATMSVSLEARAPMLDHRLVELAVALPRHALVRDGVGKWVLRRVLDRYVPRNLIERPKVGFSIPLAQWLRGPLRDWAESLLDPATLNRQGFLDAKKITEMWQQHVGGLYDRNLSLWNVLMFQAWLAAQDNAGK
ncbi:asparagine synthase (glutamine-hydrolyzing) [Ralstonia soli]|uniref:asparagine synthase (glutamine-hydrolyzing) n=1 Tax=Ralstonia soli TaxID=2953896 RepID=A0ABT1AGQ7_9RALS|nr:asparagine synthase (glutamine-hydrolyzing) [Ralstonia soli]MCO5397488.1 asparagine synthase (glutamine-hydrolyzing) [Ralstonia soli]